MQLLGITHPKRVVSDMVEFTGQLCDEPMIRVYYR